MLQPIGFYTIYNPGTTVALLLPLNVNTGITDTKGHSISTNGLALNTSSFKYGDASLYLNGSAVLSIANSTDFDAGNQDFAIEFWYKHVAHTQYSGLFNRDGVDYPLAIGLSNVSGGKFYFAAGTNNQWYAEIAATSAPSTSEFEHWAFTRNGSLWSIWKNGTLEAQVAATGGSIGAGADNMVIGGNSSFRVTGYLDSFKYTIGSPVYTNSFTPGQLTDT